ncbi:alpha/beta hydrolase [Actinomadura sp. PM05-2]|uniref:Alpha/beta hydrolase n=1 Tax=Actinomadura parmotrematis TaxID=2864039 RepID=A0ABS7FTP1_9ACTN|nr:alpha/beta hydrolase [Actinomadura parmotrematis]
MPSIIGLGAAALAPAPGAAAAAAPALAAVAWKPCPKNDPVEKDALRGLQCGTLRVPLDHARPGGEKITLALTRARHKGADYQGAVLLNRGGPGAHGRDMPALITDVLPAKVADSYDWIGFDPRGVGASRPALVCDPSYQDPGRPRADTVPASAAAERAWVARAKRYAADCGRRYPRMLAHMGTADWARDMDAIRAALGQEQISYFGYSYGTYLGAVYATMYPGRVRRMVLDSVVKPSGVWYGDNLDQNVAFEKRIRAFYGWAAAHDGTYRLGKTRKAVEASYFKARKALKKHPLKKRVGASELDDVFLSDGYADYGWPEHAAALSRYLRKHDGTALYKAWQRPTKLDQNNYAVYTAVQCRDAAWPRDWATWHRDNTRLYRQGNRFETWSNAWYNAPCAFWPVPGGPAPAVGGVADLTAPLLVQATEDAATPYDGGVETHRRFPASRLIVQAGGGNHGVSLSGDPCVDRAVIAYLADGALPPDRSGPDLVCKAGPPPAASREARRLRGPARPPAGPVAAPARATS